MGLDNSTLLTVTAQDTVDTVLQEMGPAMDDLLCTIEEVDAIKGTLPYFAAKDQAGKDLGAIAIGSDPIPVDFDLSSISYACERYHHSCSLDQSEIQDLNQYTSALAKAVALPMLYNRIAREADLYALMTNASFNGQQAASNGAWSLSTSDPYVDMQAMQFNDVPVIDMAVMSLSTLHDLQVHPATKEMAGAAYAGSAVAPMSIVRQAIANTFEIDPSRVFVWKTIQDASKFGQAFSLSRVVSGDFFWAGQQAGLIKVTQRGQQNRTTVETDHLRIENAVADTCDFLRVETYAGGEITGL